MSMWIYPKCMNLYKDFLNLTYNQFCKTYIFFVWEHKNKHHPKQNSSEVGVFLVIMNGIRCLAHSQCHTSNLTICSVFYGFFYHEHNLLDFNDARMVSSAYHKSMQLILHSKCDLTHCLHLDSLCCWRFSYLWHCREFTNTITVWSY